MIKVSSLRRAPKIKLNVARGGKPRIYANGFIITVK